MTSGSTSDEGYTFGHDLIDGYKNLFSDDVLEVDSGSLGDELDIIWGKRIESFFECPLNLREMDGMYFPIILNLRIERFKNHLDPVIKRDKFDVKIKGLGESNILVISRDHLTIKEEFFGISRIAREKVSDIDFEHRELIKKSNLISTGMAFEFFEGLGFDLADAFASHSELFSDFFERVHLSSIESETHDDNLTFSWCEEIEHLVEILFEESKIGSLVGCEVLVIFDEIPEGRIFFTTNW